MANLYRSTAAIALITGLAGPACAQAQGAVQEIDVPAQPLLTALGELGTETGYQVSADGDLVADAESAAVSGRMTPQDALAAMLAGTGLSSRALGQNSALITPASVAPANAEGAVLLDQILVQGELQTRTLQDTQTSVAVITGEELEMRSDSDLFSVLERTPGVTTGANGINTVIRGIQEQGAGVGGGRTITTRVDGASVSSIGRFRNTRISDWDLQQIEILRGPQSTQSGRNSLAGAVEVRSNDPTYDLEAKARAEVGNGPTFGGAFAVNAPAIDDMLAFRLSVDREDSAGFIENLTLDDDDFGESDFTTIRGSVRFDPLDDLSAIFKYTYTRDAIDSERVFGASFPDDRVNFSNEREFRESEGNAFNLRLSYDITDSVSIESESTYLTGVSSVLFDNDGGAEPLGAGAADNDSRLFEQEVKVFYETDRLNAVLGGFFTDIRDEDVISSLAPANLLSPTFPAVETVSVNIEREIETRNFAFFGEAEVRVLPNLSLIAGARYDRETVDDLSGSNFTTSDPGIEPFLPPSGPAQATSATFDAFLPKVGLVYDFTDDLSLGFTVQRGYRAGGASLNFATGEVLEFDPEFTWNYELSLRSQWFDQRLTVNANVFYTDWNDQQVSVPGPSGLASDLVTVNAGESRLFGGELDVRARPTDNLEVFASLAYADTEFTDFVSNGVQLAGNRFPFAAAVTASVGGTYFFDNGIFLSADANFTDDTFVDLQNTEALKTDSFVLVNARLGYEAENWGVFLFVDNLIDDDYLTRTNFSAAGRAGPVIAGDPRTFGIVGQIRF
ncbi:MAG: TonB-dependent receptor [Pseudomonadota bacterium]